MSSIPMQLHALDQPMLTGIVRSALHDNRVEAPTWSIHSLCDRATAPMSGGLYRITGAGAVENRHVAWSFVLKIVRTWPECTPASFPPGWDPQHHCYWKREPLAYASGLLAEGATGVAPPRVYGVLEQPGDIVWIALEDLTDAYPTGWSLARYRLAARHLGEFNGAFLTTRSFPAAPWLNHRCLRTLSAPRPEIVALIDDPATWEHPLVRHAFPRPVAARLRRLLADHTVFHTALERLPRTLCHHDAHRHNLVACRGVDGADRTVAIDWAQVGTGAIGEDLVQLSLCSLLDEEVTAVEFPQWQDDLVAAYLDGLRAAGWQGTAELARFGYMASAALRGTLNALERVLGPALDRRQQDDLEQRSGRPIDELLEQRASLVYAPLDAADEARRLLTCVVP